MSERFQQLLHELSAEFHHLLAETQRLQAVQLPAGLEQPGLKPQDDAEQSCEMTSQKKMGTEVLDISSPRSERAVTPSQSPAMLEPYDMNDVASSSGEMKGISSTQMSDTNVEHLKLSSSPRSVHSNKSKETEDEKSSAKKHHAFQMFSDAIEAKKQARASSSSVSEKFKMQKPWYLINPEQSVFMNRWDIVTMFALGFVALVTPVQVGLMSIQLDAFFVFSLMVDLIFLADMVLQFFLMYPVKKARTEMEWRPHRIWMHYLRTWFVIDFITLIPFDVFSIAMSVKGLSQMKGIKIIRLLRLLKLVRILKSSRVFHRLEIGVSVPYQRFALIKFLCLLLLVCHWQACIWSMTLSMTPDTNPRWIDSITALEEGLDPSVAKTKDSPFELYAAAFYFCSYTMTSVGYGDIGPKNFLERAVCTWIILLSGLCWAYILGEVCGIVGDMNADAQKFRKKMDNLNHMMRDRNLPQEMKQRLRSYFLSNKDAAQHVTQRQLLQSMSPALQGEVSMALNSVWIGKVEFLGVFLNEAEEVMQSQHSENYEAYRKCVSDLARALDTMSFCQGEVFGDIQTLYILFKGLVGLNGKVQKSGAVWGDDFVLTDPNLFTKPFATALTYIETIHLSRRVFMDVVERHRQTCPRLALRVRQFCVRLAVRRGILFEASRRTAVEAKEKRGGIRHSHQLIQHTQAEGSKSMQPENPKDLDNLYLPHTVGC